MVEMQHRNFTHDALQEMRVEFQKRNILKKNRKTWCSQIISQPFGTIYVNESGSGHTC